MKRSAARAALNRALHGRPCAIGWCNPRRRADTVHERWKRSATGPTVPTGDAAFDAWQFVAACRGCNDAIEDHPALAREGGWTATPEEAYARFPTVVARLSKVARQRERQSRGTDGGFEVA